tara:strand:- start:2627 stop:2890 length:264 start_codon:yes stop_codon:yes gene_type:complete
MHNFQEFSDYIEMFYCPEHPDCLYPIEGLTKGEIAIAILNYLDLCADNENINWGDGDSLDRERVRDIIKDNRAKDYRSVLSIIGVQK